MFEQFFKRFGVYVSLCLFNSLGFAIAQPLDLTTTQGNVNVSGSLAEFNEELIMINTPQGRLTFRQSDVQCAGPGCPNLNDRTLLVSYIENDLLPKLKFVDLLKSYSNQNDTTLSYERDRQITAVNLWGIYKQPELKITFAKDTNQISLNVSTDGIPVGFGHVDLITSNDQIANITVTQLAQIWSGQINNWSQLGGTDQTIELILPIFSDPIFYSLQMIDDAFDKKSLRQDVLFYLDSTAVQSEIERNPIAIGFSLVSDNSDKKLIKQIACDAPSTGFHNLRFPISFQSTGSAATAPIVEFISKQFVTKYKETHYIQIRDNQQQFEFEAKIIARTLTNVRTKGQDEIFVRANNIDAKPLSDALNYFKDHLGSELKMTILNETGGTFDLPCAGTDAKMLSFSYNKSKL